jgi:hypothetical protein
MAEVRRASAEANLEHVADWLSFAEEVAERLDPVRTIVGNHREPDFGAPA